MCESDIKHKKAMQIFEKVIKTKITFFHSIYKSFVLSFHTHPNTLCKKEKALTNTVSFIVISADGDIKVCKN